MSWKSGFSKGASLEDPGVECELPHHTQALRRRRLMEIILRALIMQRLHTHNAMSPNHSVP
jgi:hypothetical protein